MKKIITVLFVLCFFTGNTAQGDEIKSKSEGVAGQEVEVVSDAKHKVGSEENIEKVMVHDTQEKTQGSEFFEKYIAGRLQIGTRTGLRVLTDSDSGNEGGRFGSGTYLGTIYALDESQDYAPKYFFLKYFFNDYIAAEIAYDSVSAETVATSIGYSGDKTDGEVTVSGPTISLVAHIPNSTKFSPYGSVGLGFYSGDFDEEAHWALGYRDPSQYEALGSPSTIYGGRTRQMEIDDKIGFILGLGCTYNFNQHWLLDLSMQYTQVDVDATFYGYTNGVLDTEQEGHFPMDNFAFRLGLAYQF